ncbi:cytochrome C oxidase assembly factor 3b [Clinocottus analis]|uniref:cytochrome C oxidase assembly factor 3b n=1 Tax=Clinocottus analis TaxID=304258 RepID=UPI0035BF9F46
MAEKGAVGSAKPAPTAAEQQLLRRRKELDYWKQNAARLRGRNLLTGLTIGAFVLGMFSYTILSVKQEKIMEELDDEVKVYVNRGPRTSANS